MPGKPAALFPRSVVRAQSGLRAGPQGRGGGALSGVWTGLGRSWRDPIVWGSGGTRALRALQHEAHWEFVGLAAGRVNGYGAAKRLRPLDVGP
jgi:hypothetical protein